MAPSSCPHPVHSFAEVLGIECRGGSTLELTLKSEQLVLHSVRAGAIKAMVELFLSELQKASRGREGPRGASGASAYAPGCPVWVGWSRGCQPSSSKLPGLGLGPWNSGVLRWEWASGGRAGRAAGQGPPAGWPLPRPVTRSPSHPPACRTLAMSSPCEATSPMTAASSASTAGTSSSCCRPSIWSQVSLGASRALAREGGTGGGGLGRRL